jgi:hypothetical protein
MRQYKITAFSVFDENFRAIQGIVETKNKKYFDTHGINYISFCDDLDKYSSSRMSEKNKKYWTKIFILKNLLESDKQSEWFFLLDSDAVILEDKISLNIFPNLAHPEKEFLACETNQAYNSKFWNINTGALFCRNTKYMKEIIEDIVNIAIQNDFFNEQPIFQQMLSQNYKGLSDKTAIFPSHAFNHEGVFVYHACNFSTLDTDFKTAIQKKADFLEDKVKSKDETDSKYEKNKNEIEKIKSLFSLFKLKNDTIRSYGELNPSSFLYNPGGYDGAYSLSEKCLNKSKYVYSYGVGIYDVAVKFDIEMCKIDKVVYMYDGQVDFSSKDKNLVFKKENVDSKKIINHIYENGHANETNMTLKMDIEGAEYETIYYSLDNITKNFNQIALEVHDLLDIENSREKIQTFEKINEYYYLIHLRVNNYGKSIENFADSLELTYVRKDQFEKNEIDQVDIVYPPQQVKHVPNCTILPEVKLNWKKN